MSLPVPFAAVRFAAAALLAVACSACGGGEERPAKAPAPAVWCRPSTLASLGLGDLDRLREAGVRELFVEAARLDWRGGGEPQLIAASELVAPRRLPATLVISGDWPAPGIFADDPAGAARRLGERLRSLALAAEGGGLLPVGFHFAPRVATEAGALGGFAAVLGALRREVDRSIFVSADLDPSLLTDPDAARLAGAVDFLVVFLYGTRPGGADGPAPAAAWDLETVARGARSADALGAPFFVGAGTLGVAEVVDGRGAPVSATTRVSLGRLVGDPALALSLSTVLQGGQRRLDVFEATRATRIEGMAVEAGQRIRAERPAPGDLLELTRRLAALGLPHHLGTVYYRLAAADERLSLPVGQLASSIAGEEPPPGLELSVTATGEGRRWAVAVVLANRGELATGVALVENNYVELKISGSTFGAVDPGGFRRYALESGGRGVSNMRELRNADTLKLFVPVVEAGESVASGAIEVQATGAGDPEVIAGGRFILASGQLHDLTATKVAR